MYLHLHLHYIYITFMWPTAFPSIVSLSCPGPVYPSNFLPSRLMEFLVSFIVPPVWLCNFSWTRNERERLTRTGDGPGSCAPGGGVKNHIIHQKKNGRRGGGVVQSSSREDVFFHHLKKDLFMFCCFFEIFRVFVTEFVSKKKAENCTPSNSVFFAIRDFKSLF